MLLLQRSHRSAPHTLHSGCSVKACSWHYTGCSPCPSPAQGHILPSWGAELLQTQFHNCCRETLTSQLTKLSLLGKYSVQRVGSSCAGGWQETQKRHYSSHSSSTIVERCSGGTLQLMSVHANVFCCAGIVYHKEFQLMSALIGKERRKIILASRKAPIKIRFLSNAKLAI